MQRFVGFVLIMILVLVQIAPAALTCCLQSNCASSVEYDQTHACCCADDAETVPDDAEKCVYMALLQSPDWAPLATSITFEYPSATVYLVPVFKVAAPLNVQTQKLSVVTFDNVQVATPLSLLQTISTQLLI